MLKIINKNLSTNGFIGDDCAKIFPKYSNKPLFITQDSLIENVHFSLDFITPYQLGIKSVAVNISDLCAALSEAQFLSISLSLPSDISDNFVDEFYKGINYACEKYGCSVIGGDITGAKKIAISICAIGQQQCETNVGRSTAQINDTVILCGQVGASAIGLTELLKDKKSSSIFTKAHLNPQPAVNAIKELNKLNIPQVAAMDTSDGLADAVFKISSASNLALEIDGEKLPTLNDFTSKCEELNLNKGDTLLFGAEDFALLLTLPEKYAKLLPTEIFTTIGKVTDAKNCFISFNNKKIELTEQLIKEKTFDHFKKEKNND